MKKKSGFTLAEVLITLSIIGIIAAIVMPALIQNYQYKTVGVKLSKFMSTVEDSARAYVVSNDSLNLSKAAYSVEGEDSESSLYTTLSSFVNESFLIKSKSGTKIIDSQLKAIMGDGINSDYFQNAYPVTKRYAKADFAGKAANNADQDDGWATLKDGTRVAFYAVSSSDDALDVFTDAWSVDHQAKVPNVSQTGVPVLGVIFDPHATGLPKTVRNHFAFVVTELGYVLPADDDKCLWNLYEASWASKAALFAQGTACGKTDVDSGSSSGD